jgi:hypothetical protein
VRAFLTVTCPAFFGPSEIEVTSAVENNAAVVQFAAPSEDSGRIAPQLARLRARHSGRNPSLSA